MRKHIKQQSKSYIDIDQAVKDRVYQRYQQDFERKILKAMLDCGPTQSTEREPDPVTPQTVRTHQVSR